MFKHLKVHLLLFTVIHSNVIDGVCYVCTENFPLQVLRQIQRVHFAFHIHVIALVDSFPAQLNARQYCLSSSGSVALPRPVDLRGILGVGVSVADAFWDRICGWDDVNTARQLCEHFTQGMNRGK